MKAEAIIQEIEAVKDRLAEQAGRRHTWEADVSAMAADPEMQRELNRINGEFATIEADGLESH